MGQQKQTKLNRLQRHLPGGAFFYGHAVTHISSSFKSWQAGLLGVRPSAHSTELSSLGPEATQQVETAFKTRETKHGDVR